MVGKPLRFRYRSVDEHGKVRGLISRRGVFDETGLRLGKDDFPLELIMQARGADRFVQVLVAGPEEVMLEAIMQVYGSGKKRRRLVQAINVAASHTHAEANRRRLAMSGRESEFRAVECPCCAAMIDLSTCPPSPQVFCVFCDALLTIDESFSRAPGERRLRICEECGFYSDARQFLIFYFYFLGVVWGMSEQRRRCCSVCMRPTAWKLLVFNSIFLLGVPTAITQIIRSHFGGVRLDGNFRELARANALARKRQAAKASDLYRAIEERVQVCAGVKFNHGLAWMQAGEQHFDKAAECFLSALSDCGNYWPALAALCHCYETLSMTEELEQVKQVWGEPQADGVPAGHVADRQTAPIAMEA